MEDVASAADGGDALEGIRSDIRLIPVLMALFVDAVSMKSNIATSLVVLRLTFRFVDLLFLRDFIAI